MPTRLIGFHYPIGYGGWGRDVLGMVIGETPEGWVHVTSHVSSSADWSKADIGRQVFTWIAVNMTVPYEWIGEQTSEQIKASYPPAPSPVEVEEVSDGPVNSAGVDD